MFAVIAALQRTGAIRRRQAAASLANLDARALGCGFHYSVANLDLQQLSAGWSHLAGTQWRSRMADALANSHERTANRRDFACWLVALNVERYQSYCLFCVQR